MDADATQDAAAMAAAREAAAQEAAAAAAALTDGTSVASSFRSAFTMNTAAGEDGAADDDAETATASATSVATTRTHSSSAEVSESTALLSTNSSSKDVKKKRSNSTSLNKNETQRALKRWTLLIVLFTVLAIIVILIVTFTLKRNPQRNQGCIADYDPSVNYFPDRVAATGGVGFTVSYSNSYKWLNNSFTDHSAIVIQCGTDVPEWVIGLKNFTCPVRTAANVLLPVISFLEMAGLRTTLLYQQDPATVVSPCVQWLLEDAQTEELSLNLGQRLLQLRNVDVAFEGSEAVDVEENSISMGVLMETEPLLAAEWLKFVLSFYNYERGANELYDGITTRYTCWRDKVLNFLGSNPGTPLRNVAFVAFDVETNSWTVGADGRTTALVADAGGVVLDIHAQYYNISDLEAVLSSMDVLFEIGTEVTGWSFFQIVYDFANPQALPFMVNEQVYRLDKIQNAQGYSDWYENGIAQPDAALQDMIDVTHPSLSLEGYERRWIINLASRETRPPYVTANDCLDRTFDGLREIVPPLGQNCQP